MSLQDEPRRIRVRVPASSANLGPGFDTLGVALQLYVWIEVTVALEHEITPYGVQLEGMPCDRTNLLYQAIAYVYAQVQQPPPTVHIAVYSQIPLARGLGSSAAAIVGGMMAANALLDGRFTTAQLLAMACTFEGHPDNVAASLYGGIVVSTWDGVQAHAIRLSPPAQLTTIVAVPSYILKTSEARAVLPTHVSRVDAIYNVAHTALLVAAFATHDVQNIRHAMHDRLHQSYRAPLVPGLCEVLAGACDHGALGVALSGAGPTVIAWILRDDPHKQKLASYLRRTLTTTDAPHVVSLDIALEGCVVCDTTVPFSQAIRAFSPPTDVFSTAFSAQSHDGSTDG